MAAEVRLLAGRYSVFVDGRDTGKYATTREKAEEIMARMEQRADKPVRERKSRPEDIFALRPFSPRTRPPEPPRLAVRPRGRQYVEVVAEGGPAAGPAPFARDAGRAWTFVKEPAAALASWALRSTTRTPTSRIVIEPLAPREAGYSVLYVREMGPYETDVAYLIKRPPMGGVVDPYGLRHVWMLPELDDHAPRRVPVEILRAAIDGALQQHPLRSPQAYIR